MARVLETLWDLLGISVPERVAPARPAAPATELRHGAGPITRRPRTRVQATPSPRSSKAAPPTANPVPRSMQARYDAMVESKLADYGVRVRKWRTSMSGIAWQIKYRDGRVSRLIESPRPKGPMSAAIFLHEIGHHAIGFDVYKPRCLDEFHAWAFALREMEAHGLNITESVRRRMHNSLKYAVDKARRRGLRQLPEELAPYVKSYAATHGGQARARVRP
jgi:hypothetical protein